MKKWIYGQLHKYYLRKWFKYNTRTEELRQKSMKYWELTR